MLLVAPMHGMMVFVKLVFYIQHAALRVLRQLESQLEINSQSVATILSRQDPRLDLRP